MAKPTKKERAAAFLTKARDLGCVPTVDGSWVVFRPPLPADVMMEALGLGDEIAELLKADPTP